MELQPFPEEQPRIEDEVETQHRSARENSRTQGGEGCTAVQAYAPDGAIFGDEYFTEKLETKADWSFPSPDEN